jgi:hypothetical protein
MLKRTLRTLTAGAALIAATALPVIGLTGAAHAAGALTGSGTTADPYLISSAADLDAAAALVNADTHCTATAAGATYELIADVNYGGSTFADFTSTFCGVFDGNGHTISNLVNGNTVTSAVYSSALFYTLNGATVKNLTLSNVTTVPAALVAADSYPVASLAGSVTSSTITGIGLVGSTVAINAVGATGVPVGGLVNSAVGTSALPTTISNNYLSGDTITGLKYVGGLIGTVGSFVTVADNFVSAAVANTASGAGETATMLVRTVNGTAGDSVQHNVIYSGSITRNFGSSQYTGGWVSGTAPGTGITISNNLVNANNTLDKAADANLILTANPAVPPADWPYGGTFALSWTANHPYVYSGCNGATADPVTGTKCFLIGSDGTYTDPAALAAQATYDTGGLGWDFTSTWSWDATAEHPVLNRAPVVTTSTQTIGVLQNSTLDAATLESKTGASIDNGTLDADLSGVDTANLGPQSATLTGTFDGFTTVVPITVTVTAVTVPVLTVPTTSISVPEGTFPTAADVLAATGATTDTGTLGVDFGTLTSADFAAPGVSRVVTITDTGSAASATPVPVTVNVVLPGSGTAAHPYLIGSVADLDYASAMVDGDTTRTGAAIADYAVAADIDYGGATFAGFTWFGGTFDGAGHTVSNLVDPTFPGTSPTSTMFLTDTGTIENLTLSHLTSALTCVNAATNYASALVDTLAGGTVTGVGVVDSTVVMTTGACATNSFVGGLVRQTTGAATISDNLLWNTTVGGNKYAGGIVAAILSPAVVTDNLVSATIYQPTSGAGATTDGIVVQGAGTVTGNVLYGGSVTAGSGSTPTSGGTHTVGAIGGWNSTFDASTDLASSAATLNLSGNGNNAVPLDGTATSAADLAKQSTYEGVGWDFAGGTTPWVWDAAEGHPTLRTAPLLQLTGTTTFGYPAGTESAAAARTAILAASAPTVDQGSAPIFDVDLTGVDLGTVGSYTAEVTATDNGSAAQPRPVTIAIIDPSGLVVSLADATIDLNAGSSLTAAQLLARSGATAQGTIAVNTADLAAANAASSASSTGTYDVHVSTTSQGVTGPTVIAHVKVVAAGAPVITVTSTQQTHVAGDDLAGDGGAAVLTAAGATATDGSTPTVTFGDGFDEDTAGTYAATLSDGAATPVVLRITVTAVPKPVISVAHSSITYREGVAPSVATVLGDLGASITQAASGATVTVDLSGVDFSNAGAYAANVTGSWRGVAATPVPVTISVLLPGSGTAADPYLVGSATDLDAAAALVDHDTAHSGAAIATIQLTADIDYGGKTFAGFTWFGGTFDGAGHTISNIDYATTTDTKPVTAMFVTVPGTIENLELSQVTSAVTCANAATYYASGIVDTLSGTLKRVALVDSSVVMTKGACATNSFTGGLVRISSGTITDDMIWNTTVTGNKYAGAVVSNSTGVITDNLINVTVSQTQSGAGAGAGGVVATGTPASTTGNVFFDGVVGGTGTHTTSAIGQETTPGTPLGTNNLVSSNVLLAAGTNAATPDNGTAATPAALATQSTYSGIGWVFGGSGAWSWDSAGAASHPVLNFLPTDFSAPYVAVVHPSVIVSAQATEPSSADLLTAFGAAADHGTLGLDLGGDSDDGGGVNFQLAGSYPVTITGTDDGVTTALPATIVVTALVGTGTAADPLQIGNRADLDNAVDSINNGSASYSEAHFTLTADINYAGDDFVGIDSFSGVFDGDGHTISNLTYVPSGGSEPDAEVLAFFRTLDGATVEHLGLNDLQADGTDIVGGLAGNVYASNITQDSVLAATLASSDGDAGGLIGGTAYANSLADSASDASDGSTTQVSNNEVLSTTVSSPWVAGGAVGTATGAVAIADNLLDAQVTDTAVAGPGHGTSAGGVLGAVGTTSTGGSTGNKVAVSGNAVIGGGVSFQTGGARTGYAGSVIGDVAGDPADTGDYGSWTEAHDLVSPAAVLGASLTGPASSPAGKGDQDGAASTAADLSTQSAYTGLGWDFGTPVWSWDAAKTRPTLAAVPELTVPTVSVAKDSVVYQVGHVPASAQILTDLGASMTPTGPLSLDLTGADLSQTGTYDVAISGASNGVGSRAIPVTILVVPVVAISTATAEVTYVTGSTVGRAQFLTDVGAELNVPGTPDADLSGVDFATPKTYPVTITGTDSYGFTAAPVTVSVVIADAPAGPGGGSGGGGDTMTPGTVTISSAGAARVGVTLTADAGTWSPAGTPAYQWLRGGDPIGGATGQTYTPVAADAGQLVQVQVTEQPATGDPVSAASAPVTVAAGQFIAPTPTITGTASSGHTLVAVVGSWLPAPQAMAFQWLRNGVPVSGATGKTYLLSNADAGAKVSVEVDGVSDGYASILVVSGTVKVAPLPVIRSFSHTTPKVGGTLKVGRKLHVVLGTWKPSPHLAYQWLVAGKKVRGATHATYRLPRSARGKKVRVTVTATLTGYHTVIVTSAPSGRVK